MWSTGKKFVVVLSRRLMCLLAGAFQPLKALAVVRQLGAEGFQSLMGFILFCRI